MQPPTSEEPGRCICGCAGPLPPPGRNGPARYLPGHNALPQAREAQGLVLDAFRAGDITVRAVMERTTLSRERVARAIDTLEGQKKIRKLRWGEWAPMEIKMHNFNTNNRCACGVECTLIGGTTLYRKGGNVWQNTPPPCTSAPSELFEGGPLVGNPGPLGGVPRGGR